MQPRAFGTQALARAYADLQVAGDRLLVEHVGLPRQLDLAVERLVGHAQQRAVGDAEAVALRGHGGAFHLDRHRPALRQTQRRLGKAQLPVAVVGGDHGAGAHALLEVRALRAADFLGRAGKRLLHFGDRGQRDLGRENVVEHVVVAQVGVSEHEVADLLRRAQAPAVADHQPGFGPEHREVIGDRLGVRRAYADVDQRDAHVVGRHQVVGRHLVAAPGSLVELHTGILGPAIEHHAAGAGEAGVETLADPLGRPVDELVDVAVVVGEQHEALEMLGRGASVMREAGEREIGAQAIEQRQRHGLAGLVQIEAVGQFVADQRQLGGREIARKLVRADARHRGAVLPVEHVGNGISWREGRHSISTP